MKEYIVEYETEQIENSTFFYGGKIEHELIRCKDCKAYRKEYYSDEYYCNYHFEGIDGEPLRSTPNDYCAWAERMDEDD